jgi:hypothetical protein
VPTSSTAKKLLQLSLYMNYIDTRDPIAVAVVNAIQTGDIPKLTQLLADNPGLSKARLGDNDPCGMSRTLLHVATDWPGHFPNVAQTIKTLVEAGSDVNAQFTGPHIETPLHWAASSNDIEALDALIDAGANIEAEGAVIAGGTPLTLQELLDNGKLHTGLSSSAHELI